MALTQGFAQFPGWEQFRSFSPSARLLLSSSLSTRPSKGCFWAGGSSLSSRSLMISILFRSGCRVRHTGHRLIGNNSGRSAAGIFALQLLSREDLSGRRGLSSRLLFGGALSIFRGQNRNGDAGSGNPHNRFFFGDLIALAGGKISVLGRSRASAPSSDAGRNQSPEDCSLGMGDCGGAGGGRGFP